MVIDSANSFGAAPAASNATFFNLGGVTNATLEILPGITSPVVLSPNMGWTTSSGALFAFTVNGAPTINDSTGTPTTGLIGNSELDFQGALSGTSTGTTGLNKLGYGTLNLRGEHHYPFGHQPIAISAWNDTILDSTTAPRLIPSLRADGSLAPR